MIINKVWFLYLFIGLFFLSACNNNAEIIEATYIDFGDKGILDNPQFTFYPFEKLKDRDAKDSYVIYLAVRYSDNCNLKTLPVRVEYASLENDSIIEKQLNVPLFDDNGSFLGKGNLGIYESEVVIMDNQPSENGFFISVSPREKNVKGILSLGVICNYD